MLRAIFIGDARYDECNTFELNITTGHFHMINESDISYPFDHVMNDPDFIIVAVCGEEYKQLLPVAQSE